MDPPESWEEEAASPISTSSPVSTLSTPSTPLVDSTPGPPPPTPISPTQRRGKTTDLSTFPTSPHSRDSPRGVNGGLSAAETPDKRPEKSSAAAGRMIAGALGVKGPKLTEEQRREDQKRREMEKEEARRAIWDE
ncbi:MAG: hypothetical protein Q9163_001205 [Psora crenata]